MSASVRHLAQHVYFERQFNCVDAKKILSDEYCWTGKEMAIITVLGSYLSAFIRDRISGVGGMNHFMLPSGREADNPASISMRYGHHAMEILINELLKAGAMRQNLEVKIFGGGRVRSGFLEMNVGVCNADFLGGHLRLKKFTW